MPFRGLDTGASFILIAEVDESASLAEVGLRTLNALRYVVDEHAAVLTLLSIASEKMLKIALGLNALDRGEPWPERKQMQEWGHDVARLDDRVRGIYREQRERSTAPGYIQQLLDQCDSIGSASN